MNTSKSPRGGSAENYAAKYLVLLGGEGTLRVLLFDRHHHYLAEVIEDDGLLLDNLMRVGTMCSLPADLARHALASTPATLRCFALG